MKNYLLLIAILGVFFWIGVATSPPREEFDFQQYPSSIEALPDAIVLTSQSEIPIENASLWLTIDSVATNNLNFFSIENYNLAANASDTIPLMDFMFQDSIAFPSGETPDHFTLEFFANGVNFVKEVDF